MSASNLQAFQDFVDATGSRHYVEDARRAYNRLCATSMRRGIIYPDSSYREKELARREQADRFLMTRLCRYCEHTVEWGRQCRNCGDKA